MTLHLLDDEVPRIAFCGASGTGKTVLAKWLAAELNVPFNPVGARSVAIDMGFVDGNGEARPYDVDISSLTAYEQGVPNLQESTPERRLQAAAFAKRMGAMSGPSCRLLFQKEVQRQKILWELSNWGSGFVTDRSTIDDLTYCALHGIRGVEEDYLNRALEHCARYSFLFMTPISSFHDIGTDGARVHGVAYHRIFETLLEGLIFSVPHEDVNGLLYQITISGLEERKKFVSQVVGLEGYRKHSMDIT